MAKGLTLKERIASTAKKSTQKEKNAIKDKAKKELIRLEKVFKDDKERKIDIFKDKYSICEIVYKKLLSNYIINYKKENPPSKLKIKMNQIPFVLAYSGYTVDIEILKKLFGYNVKSGEKSARLLRNDLTHNLKQSAVDELLSRYEELDSYLDTFLNAIRNKQ